MQKILKESGYIGMLKESKVLEDEARLETLDELFKSLEEFDDAKEFLDYVSLVMDKTNTDNYDTLTISTIHAAKGLEFHTVFIPGFEDAVVGHSVGEKFTIDVTFPENYQVEELKGQPVQFEIDLHKIQTRELPEFNEDFVKDVSEFDTIDDYKADIREKLAADKAKQADEDKERQIGDKLAELMQAEVPEVMYENQIDNLVDEFAMNLRMQGIDLKTYMEYTGLTDELLHQTYYDRAVSQVKVRLALKKIAKLENIEVTDEDVENKYKELADSYKVDVSAVKGAFSEKDIKSDLEAAKALELVENAFKTSQ